MTTGIIPGCILHWKNHKFDDGGVADKYFVILGAKAGSNYLAVIATSRQHHMEFKPGCHHEAGYYHIPGGAKDWFPKDTWLLLFRPIELSAQELLKLAMVEKQITTEGHLRPAIANAIRECLKLCLDVSPAQKALL